MAEKRLFKEYHQLAKNGPENPQIVCLEPLDPSDVFAWEAVICKPDKNASPYYYNGQWKLEIKVDSLYPMSPPKIKFSKSTPIAHPNIDIETGEICLDILKSENWSPAWNLHHLVVAILVLLDDPEPDSPLNLDLANLFRYDKLAFESFVQFTIWKNGNFFQGQKLASGVRDGDDSTDVSGDRNASRDYSGDDEVKGSLLQSAWVDVGTQATTKPEVEENFKLIKNVGEQITKEFLNKAYEVQHSREPSLDDAVMDNAKQQITENVKKQVDQLCVKSVSPPGPRVDQRPQVVEPVSHAYEAERQNFIKQVDEKIRRITSPQSQPIEPVTTASSADSSVGSLRRSDSIKKPSSLNDVVNKPKKSKRKMLKKLVKREDK